MLLQYDFVEWTAVLYISAPQIIEKRAFLLAVLSSTNISHRRSICYNLADDDTFPMKSNLYFSAVCYFERKEVSKKIKSHERMLTSQQLPIFKVRTYVKRFSFMFCDISPVFNNHPFASYFLSYGNVRSKVNVSAVNFDDS